MILSKGGHCQWSSSWGECYSCDGEALFKRCERHFCNGVIRACDAEACTLNTHFLHPQCLTTMIEYGELNTSTGRGQCPGDKERCLGFFNRPIPTDHVYCCVHNNHGEFLLISKDNHQWSLPHGEAQQNISLRETAWNIIIRHLGAYGSADFPLKISRSNNHGTHAYFLFETTLLPYPKVQEMFDQRADRDSCKHFYRAKWDDVIYGRSDMWLLPPLRSELGHLYSVHRGRKWGTALTGPCRRGSAGSTELAEERQTAED